VCELIDSMFIVDPEKSTDKIKSLAHDQFGYLSTHKIITLSKSRLKLKEWKKYKDIIAEVQVRTVLQHAWATISHSLQYKHEDDVPYEFRRKLTRVSGLLELSDEEFCELRNAQKDLIRDLTEKIRKSEFNVPIDIHSVNEYLSASPTVDRIFQILKSLRYTEISRSPEDEFLGEEQILERKEDTISQIPIATKYIEIESIEALDELLLSIEPNIEQFYLSFYKENQHGDLGHWLSVAIVAAQSEKIDTNAFDSFPIWSKDYLKETLEKGKKAFNAGGKAQ